MPRWTCTLVDTDSGIDRIDSWLRDYFLGHDVVELILVEQTFGTDAIRFSVNWTVGRRNRHLPYCDHPMKCQYCEKPATFHITELTEPSGPQVMHLCEEHARGFLQKESETPAASIAGVLAKQLQLGQTKQELAELDQKECPVCGITFYEFRNSGRLGCPFDYSHFEEDLQPLLINVHDATEHTGKRPKRAAAAADSHAELIQLRREMEEAVEREDYERASEIRDELKRMESGTDSAEKEETE